MKTAASTSAAVLANRPSENQGAGNTKSMSSWLAVRADLDVMAASMTAAILGPMVRAQIWVTWKSRDTEIECRETLTVSLEPMAIS